MAEMDLWPWFESLAAKLPKRARDGEHLILNLSGEDSTFLRLNQGRIRQLGQVLQLDATLDLIQDRRQARASLSLSGEHGEDLRRLERALAELRSQLPQLPQDPHLLFAERVSATSEARPDRLPGIPAVTADIGRIFPGDDLVGILAMGRLLRAYGDSRGGRHWYSDSSFNFDWSLHLPGGQAVKACYAGDRWEPEALEALAERARRDLELLSRPPVRLAPGPYRVYLAPAALNELIELIAWTGFGLKAHRSRQTPLLRMVLEGLQLSPRVTLREDNGQRLGPRFTTAGFTKPAAVTLIEAGRYRDCLVGPRNAAEYGAAVNAEGEIATALCMAGGDLEEAEVLDRLGDGLYISNLWYTNFSDRSQCRITGLTRFACYQVRDGRPVSPFEPMRFDDSLLRILGEGLVDLNRHPVLLPDPHTYQHRNPGGRRLPGALVEGFRLTM